MKHNRPRGFTVVELMMATTIFSVILLIGLTGFVQVGKAYYKGITISQTQNVAKQIINSVSSQIRLSSSVASVQSASANRSYLCVGSHRYTFKMFNMVNSAAHDYTDNFGLVKDELPGNSGCANPFDSPGAVPLNNPAELLGNRMRLLAFSVQAVSGNPNLYSVNVKVAFGADSALTDPASSDSQCKLSPGATQFCAVTNLTTVVYQGS